MPSAPASPPPQPFHVHICRDIRHGCYSSEDFVNGRYGGVLPRDMCHRHDKAEPGHGYSWPDLRANGNSPAEGHVYLGGVWIVQVGDTLTADTRHIYHVRLMPCTPRPQRSLEA